MDTLKYVILVKTTHNKTDGGNMEIAGKAPEKTKMKSRFTLLFNQDYRGVFVRYPNGFAFIPYGCFVHNFKVVPAQGKLQDLEGFAKFRSNLIRASMLAQQAKKVTGIYQMDFFGNFEQIHRMKEQLDCANALPGITQAEVISCESREILPIAA